MSLKNTLIRLLVGLCSSSLGWFFIDHGFSSPSDAAIKEYERLCKGSAHTQAIVQNITKEHTNKKRRKSSWRTYSYTYTVAGNACSGQFTTQNELSSTTMTIWYDPQKPNVSLTIDPCKQLVFSKSMQYPTWYSVVGPLLFLVGIVLVFKSSLKLITWFKQVSA